MKLQGSNLLLLLAAAMGCGANGDPTGTGGTGGNPASAQSAYRLTCTIDTLVLEIPIELVYELDQPFVEGGSAELTFSAAATFNEQASLSLINAGVSKIDIISATIASSIEGATPASVQTSFAAAPINDFDLSVDTDENGAPGPHRLDFDAVTITATVAVGAQLVELGLDTSDVSIVLGDFEVPNDCLRPVLLGFTARFPVDAPEPSRRQTR